MAKAQLRAAGLANLSTAGRVGDVQSIKTPEGIATGLELSGVQYKPSSWFKPNPENHVFDNLKTESYLENLKRDISDAGAILNPLIAMPDGTLVEGHSRIAVVKELEAEGRWSEAVPVRLILTQITQEEIRKRVYLGNLSRFEIDVNTRAVLYRDIWPDFVPTTATVAVKSATEAVLEVAANTGMKERQVWNERKIIQKADELAKAEGKAKAEPKHVAKAREERNSERREKGSTATVAVKGHGPQNAAKKLKTWATQDGTDLRDSVKEVLKTLNEFGLISQAVYKEMVEVLVEKP